MNTQSSHKIIKIELGLLNLAQTLACLKLQDDGIYPLSV